MSLRVLIADDEPLAVDLMRRSLAAIEGLEVVGTASDGAEALDRIAALTPDVIFLDIQMPGLSGVDVARRLTAEGGPDVVFVTAFADFATVAFELDAVDYLLKPYRPDRLEETVSRARRRQRPPSPGLSDPATASPPADPDMTPAAAYERTLWVPQRDGLTAVQVQDIERIEAARDYALLFTRSRSFLLRTTMAELERRLDPDELVRVHRSAFVRPEAVVRAERREHSPFRLHMRDGGIVDVGPSYVKRITERMTLSPRGSKGQAEP